ncbi:MAG TPA: proton-conducting transporter membrane subunit [Candidatus Dormibacteraeota bacterium]|nr:proton-conducting transporter membrane subunit [Candidatus Dormibacteraeota bacterium]
MSNLVLLPEALVVAGALVLLIVGRVRRRSRRWLPLGAVAIALAALLLELWVGSALATYFGGALVQDRFALFAKAAVLLAAALALAVTDWSDEDTPAIAMAMILLAAFGVMVIASAGDFVGLWAGLELAAAAGVVLVSLGRSELGLRLLVVGGVASALVLVGFAFVYASTGSADLLTVRRALRSAGATLPLAIPVLLLLAGLAVRAGLPPFQFARLPIGLAASPLGASMIIGLVAAAALTVAIKVAAALTPVPAVFSPYLMVVAAVAMVGGGAAALATRSPRARLAYLAAGQVGWVAAGLATHYRTGLGSSLFLLGAFAVAATAGPAVMAGADVGEFALAGLGVLRPARAAGIALVFLSLAGAPPLAGFFGEFAVAASLAQTGAFWLVALGFLGALMSTAAALGTVRAIYLQSPPDDSRRAAGARLPVLTRLSTIGAIAICIVIGGYGVFANPILGLADQGAEALGLR